MKIKFIIITALIGASIVGAFYYQKSPRNNLINSHVNASLGPEPATMDPSKNLDSYVSVYIQHVFEGLTKMNSKNEAIPAMAERWEISQDGLIYTFHIKKEAKWSDGKDVLAQDFVYGWERTLAPETASQYVDRLYFINNAEKYNKGLVGADKVGIRAIDDKTLEVILEKPISFFIALTSIQPFSPLREDVISKNGDAWTQDSKTYIGNGPYVLTVWNHNSTLEMVRNPFYYDSDKMKINSISWKLTSDDTTALNAFLTGELDFNSGFINTNELPRLKKENKVTSLDALSVSYIIFNTERAPFNNVKFRQALSLAIDRKDLTDNVLRAGDKPATGFIPYGMPSIGSNSDFRKDNEAKEYFTENADLDEAKKLLAEAGYPGGKNLKEFEYLTSKNSTNLKIAEYMQNQWAKIGVKIKIVQLEQKVFSQYRSEGKYEITKGSWGADYYDPYTFFSAFVSESLNNYPRWKNRSYDEMVAKAQSATDKTTQLEYSHRAEDVLMSDLPIIPLFFLSQHALINPSLKGVYMNSIYQTRITNAYWGN